MEPVTKQDIVNYRRQKAKDLLRDAQVLIENEMWNSAVNRLYYACFHAVSALLVLHDIHVKSHQGLRHNFGLHFIKTGILDAQCGKIFTTMYDMRQSSDYDDFCVFTNEEILDVYPRVIHLIEQVDELIETSGVTL